MHKSWMCRKKTSVPHSSTESEIISLDVGLRLDGIPAVDLWDLIVFVLGNTTQNHDRTGQPAVKGDKDHRSNKRSQGMMNVLNNIDCVPSNVQFSNQEALLCVFEDNEAVIKMIVKGRSPMMRHVSRTHRVALDWLFDRINLDSKIQIKFNSQEEVRLQQFVIGNDEAELELSVESRSFLNRVNDQVRKRQKNNFKCHRRRKTFYDLGNVHGCNNGISGTHGKEVPEQLTFHREYKRSHTQTNVRHIYKNGV